MITPGLRGGPIQCSPSWTVFSLLRGLGWDPVVTIVCGRPMRSVIPHISLHYAAVWLCCCCCEGKEKKKKRDSQNCCVLTCQDDDKANDRRVAVGAFHVLKPQRQELGSCCFKSAIVECVESQLFRNWREKQSHLCALILPACCGLWNSLLVSSQRAIIKPSIHLRLIIYLLILTNQTCKSGLSVNKYCWISHISV